MAARLKLSRQPAVEHDHLTRGERIRERHDGISRHAASMPPEPADDALPVLESQDASKRPFRRSSSRRGEVYSAGV